MIPQILHVADSNASRRNLQAMSFKAIALFSRGLDTARSGVPVIARRASSLFSLPTSREAAGIKSFGLKPGIYSRTRTGCTGFAGSTDARAMTPGMPGTEECYEKFRKGEKQTFPPTKP